ncbi:MAG: bifunctional DNA-formamidopyrimidine glycosylase/DNA-(apurinic or apyrimidinic site) lyase [Hyphomicrobiales bacterium]
MPELPEVETVRRGLAEAMEGRRFAEVTVRRADLRFPLPVDFAARLRGRRLIRLARRAKYLLGFVEGGAAMILHLGMSGRFIIIASHKYAKQAGRFYYDRSPEAAAPHDHVVFTMEDATRIIYNDPRRFGMMDLARETELSSHQLLRDLGPEPLGDDFDAPYLADAFKTRQTSLKAALLDQKLVAGLGNIYVCEALFRAKLSPLRTASSLAGEGTKIVPLERLIVAIRRVLEEAIAAGGSSLRDYARTDGSLGYFQHKFAVYDREGEPCPKPGCSGTIERIAQNGRSTFYCAQCQE